MLVIKCYGHGSELPTAKARLLLELSRFLMKISHTSPSTRSAGVKTQYKIYMRDYTWDAITLLAFSGL